MGFDAISNAHICAFSKDSSKKKRVNKMAKLRHNKLDSERQHYLIQVNNKEYITETNNVGRANCPSVPIDIEGRQTRENRPRSVRRDEHEINWMSHSIDRHSCRNIFDIDFNRRRSVSSRSSGTSSSSCSEEDRDKGCLDDWEADSKSRAWTPDDVFRPRSLPRISRQTNNVQVLRVDKFSCENQHSVCPICCEDFDVTDSSFLPCPCGFRLCLFCHKKIIEVDGRCPGCRKRYVSENAGFQRAVF